MLRRRLIQFGAALCAAAGMLATSVEPATAIGYYNLPGSFCQCFGYGKGAGYHSCLVLGPSTCSGCCATNEVRLQYPPQPPYACYGNCQCGLMDGETWLGEPTMLPSPGPQFTPGPAAMRPQILR